MRLPKTESGSYRISRVFRAALPDTDRYAKSSIRQVLCRIGARRFELPTSWSRTKHLSEENPAGAIENADSGVTGEGCCSPRCSRIPTDPVSTGLDDADLRAVVAAWPTLPEPVKAGIVAMIAVTSGAGGER